eukprot:scaffold75720_cov58-Phaeocystis_antarctica.AAC.2
MLRLGMMVARKLKTLAGWFSTTRRLESGVFRGKGGWRGAGTSPCQRLSRPRDEAPHGARCYDARPRARGLNCSGLPSNVSGTSLEEKSKRSPRDVRRTTGSG